MGFKKTELVKIKTAHSKKNSFSAIWLLLLLLPVLWWSGKALFFFIQGQEEEILFCDMEEVTAEGGEFICSGKRLFNGETRSDEEALSGKYSAKCTGEQPYGPTAVFPDLSGGDVLEARVWRHVKRGEGKLVMEGDWGAWVSAGETGQERGDWALLALHMTVPLSVRSATVKVYPLAQKGSLVYFDDLEIRVLRHGRAALVTLQDSFPRLDVQLDEQAYRQLQAKRTEALRRGNLISDRKDLVPARLFDGEEEIPVKLRLKGDLLDHLQGKKWSFRILCEPGHAWRGMQIFSVHNAASRYYLDEWVYHRLLLDAGLLTTPYDFLELALNGESLGVYAYEQHFTDALLESQGREPGLLIRIDEAGHWLHASENLKDRPAWYQSAGYLPYERKKVLDDPQRYQQWLRAQDLLYGFFKGDLKPAEVFDTARLARFLALTDLARAFHALNFTNIRFYYDPLNDWLEPLGYDGYSTDGTKWFEPPALFGSHYNSRSKNTYQPGVEDAYFAYRLFNDTAFTKVYIRALQQFTSDAFVQDFLAKHLPAMEAREAFIRREYTAYDFKWGDYFRNAEEIRKLLNPLALTSVKGWAGRGGQVVLENYHLFPVEVVGFGDGKKPDYLLRQPLLLEAYDRAVPVRSYETRLPRRYKYLFVRTLGLSSLHREKLATWEAPTKPVLVEKEEEFVPDFVQNLGDGIWHVPSGKYTLDRDWVVPSGGILRMGPGVELDLLNGAMLISRAAVDFRGTADAPIRFFSSDGSGQGLLLLEAEGKSFFSHVQLEGMNARKAKPPFTKAAFTVYQSDIRISHCSFLGAKAENAVHLLQASYGLEDLLIGRASGDGLDIDRSTGEVRNLRIEACGEDGLEVSAGYAALEDLSFSQLRASALRVHLDAEVRAKELSLEACVRGLTVQDGGYLFVDGLYARDVRQLLLAYRKSENASSGGHLEVLKVDADGIDKWYLMDAESRIVIESEEQTLQ